MAKRLVCMLLAVLCLVACVGCNQHPAVSEFSSSVPVEDDNPAPPQEQVLTGFAVGYNKEDTLNPFTAKSEVNGQLSALLYDSLTVLGADFSPRLSLASKVDSPDATHLTATVKKGATFSDGSPVTAADVVASYKEAKQSAAYKLLLANVTNATAADGKVTFTLQAPDVNSKACLSFPIVKATTLTNEVGKAPVGSGMYKLKKAEGKLSLVRNTHSSKKPRFSTVELHHLPNAERLYYGLTAGNITYYYDDLASGTIPQVTGATAAVDMNALVFLGVRSGHKALSQPAVRGALSSMLDRTALAGGAYAGWATPTLWPFHPHWAEMGKIQLTAPARDLEGAMEALRQAGYATDKQPLELELVYCSDQTARGVLAEQIRAQCEGIGVKITPVPLAYDAYIQRLKSGKFDLYLGEVRLAANMSLSPLFSGGAAYGVNRKGQAVTAYGEYLSGQRELSAFLDAFAADMPFVPLFWRQGFAAYDRRLTVATPTGYNAYYGFEKWK